MAAEDLEEEDLAAAGSEEARGRVLADSTVAADSVVASDRTPADSAVRMLDSEVPVAAASADLAAERTPAGSARPGEAGPDLAIEASVRRAPPATVLQRPAATN